MFGKNRLCLLCLQYLNISLNIFPPWIKPFLALISSVIYFPFKPKSLLLLKTDSCLTTFVRKGRSESLMQFYIVTLCTWNKHYCRPLNMDINPFNDARYVHNNFKCRQPALCKFNTHWSFSSSILRKAKL